MGKIMLYTKYCTDEQDNAYCLRYFVLTDPTECGTVYGIEIEKEGAGRIERECVHGLLAEREEAERFLWKLWNGTAFPVELSALCDDLITEREKVSEL